MVNTRSAIWYHANKELARLRNKKWFEDNRERRAQYIKEYRKTKRGKEATLRAIRKYEKTHPERRKAWGMALCIKLEPCIKCGKTPTHRHHPDPLKPLEVIFLCPFHHRQVHML